MTRTGEPSAPQTRMLLASDGSTTTLLQAMLGQRLELRLDEVSMRTGNDVPQGTRSALRISGETPVMVRRSALVTRLGLEVSRNRVVACGPFTGLVGQVMNAALPIGGTMNGGRTGHHRILLDSGWASWSAAGSVLPCAFKSYVIVDDGRRVIHLVERFSPDFVPIQGHVAPRSADRGDDHGPTAEAV